MRKRRICVLVTARPSYSRIRSALRAIQAHPELELQLVVAASALLERYGGAIQAIEHDGFTPKARVYMVLEGENLVTSAKSTGLGLVELATVFDNLEPDAVVTVADRYETLATAVAAAYMNIPVVHVQGGEVTGSIDEKVRHAVTKLANLHLVSTALARDRVIRLGEVPESVVLTGCPSIDIAADVAAKPDLDFDPFARYGGVGPREDLSKGYLVVMQHPVTTEYEEARQQVDETLYAVKDVGTSGALVLAQRRRRLGRHVERDSRVPREGEGPELPLFPQHAARGLPSAALWCVGHRGQLERRHSRVLVPRRARGEHWHPAARARTRPQRDRRRSRSRGDCRRHSRARAAWPARRRSAVR